MKAPSLSVAWSMITMPRVGYVAVYKTGGRGGDGVTDDDRTFQAGCLHQGVDLISDVCIGTGSPMLSS